MDALERALKSLDVIVLDENIFTVIEYSLIDPQMKNVIYVHICKIGKIHKTTAREVNTVK